VVPLVDNNNNSDDVQDISDNSEKKISATKSAKPLPKKKVSYLNLLQLVDDDYYR
jgi:hypothetical protein